MANTKSGYTFLRWNGEYGQAARFVVRNNANGKQSLFTPGNLKDLIWVDSDLTQDPAYSQWDGFENETVDNLDDVVF